MTKKKDKLFIKKESSLLTQRQHNKLARMIRSCDGTKREFAKRFNTTEQAVNHWFNRGIPLSTLVRIHKASNGAFELSGIPVSSKGKPDSNIF